MSSSYGDLWRQKEELKRLEALKSTQANKFGSITNQYHGLQVEHQSRINQSLINPDPNFPPSTGKFGRYGG